MVNYNYRAKYYVDIVFKFKNEYNERMVYKMIV